LPVIIGIISDARERKEHGHLRMVLYAKDRGCAAPTCTVPARGDTEWTPPPHLDRGLLRTNTYWHPEKLRHGIAPPGRTD
jgi:hypothetical protein